MAGHFFRSVYENIGRLTAAQDVSGLQNLDRHLLHPKFIYVDVHGNRIGAEQLMRRTSEQLKIPYKYIGATITPLRVWKDGDFTKVLTSGTFKFDLLGKDNRIRHATSAATNLDTWILTNAGYQLFSQKTVSEKAWVDKALVGSTKVEGWQLMVPKPTLVTSAGSGGKLSLSKTSAEPWKKYGVAIQRLTKDVHEIKKVLASKPWQKKSSKPSSKKSSTRTVSKRTSRPKTTKKAPAVAHHSIKKVVTHAKPRKPVITPVSSGTASARKRRRQPDVRVHG